MASDLSWSGPLDCAQSEQLLFEIERALGAPLALTGQVHLQVHVARTAPDARAVLRVRTDGAAPASERSLVAPDCAKLIDTLAVAITLAVEAAAPDDEAFEAGNRSGTAPGSTRASSEAMPAPVPSLASDQASAAPSEAAFRTDSTRSRGPSPLVIAMLTGDSGSLPAPAVGVALGARLDFMRFQLELIGTLWVDQHTRLAGALQDAGGDVGLATGTLWACTRPFADAGDPLSLALCAGAEVGRLSGSGSGITQPRRASALWLAPHVQLDARWRLPGARWGLGARAGAGAPLERREFVLDGLGTVHQPAGLVGRVALIVDVALQ